MYTRSVERIRGSRWRLRRLRWRAHTPRGVWVLFGMMLIAVLIAVVLVATLS